MNYRCPGCPGTHRAVPFDGPQPCRIMAIAERPGITEDREGTRCLIGKAGLEFNENYLQLAGIDRLTDIRVGNTVRCRNADKDIKPTLKEIECCAGYFLPEEIAYTQPEIIIPMGSTACQIFGGYNLDLEHGIPRRVENVRLLGGWSGTVIPMYHPDAGMHDTATMIPLLKDWENLGKWLKGKWKPPQSNVKKDYQLLDHHLDVWDEMNNVDSTYNYLPIDTESHKRNIYSIQWSLRPGHGRMILTENKYAVQAFTYAFKHRWHNRTVMHNALHDIDELRQVGIDVKDFRDTMVEAYELCDLPQALKELTYRLLGCRMKTYPDVVIPHSKEALKLWLYEALDTIDSKWKIEHREQLKTKVRVTYKNHPAQTVVQRVLRSLDNPESDYDAWMPPKRSKGKETKRLIGQEWLAELERLMGEMPVKSIKNVPLEEAVAYGCSDADKCGRVWLRLEEERKVRIHGEWMIDDEDVDR